MCNKHSGIFFNFKVKSTLSVSSEVSRNVTDKWLKREKVGTPQSGNTTGLNGGDEYPTATAEWLHRLMLSSQPSDVTATHVHITRLLNGRARCETELARFQSRGSDLEQVHTQKRRAEGRGSWRGLCDSSLVHLTRGPPAKGVARTHDLKVRTSIPGPAPEWATTQ